MAFSIFYNIKPEEKTLAIERLITKSADRQEFFVMMVLAVLMATFGLLIGSETIIIGSMLIAPVIYPLLGITLSIVMADFKLLRRSFITFIKMCLFAVAVSAVVTIFLPASNYPLTQEILSRINPSLVYFSVAITAGLAVAFAMVKESISESLPGVAISVALMPPLVVIGIGLARFDWDIISGSFLLFLVNALGIMLSASVMYSLMGFARKRVLASKVAETTDKDIAKEAKAAELAEKKDINKD